MMKQFLALDQGTTSSRAIVFNEVGEMLSSSQEELSLQYPGPGWVEQTPREILETQCRTAERALREAGGEIAAVGITNQRETTILWDRATGEALSPAIVWQDRRTAAYCEDLRKTHGERVLEKTGLVIDPYFSASKIRWLLDSDAALRRRAESGEVLFGTVDSYLLWHLSQGQHHLTDVSNASRTMLFNLHTLSWDQELLDLFNVPREMLPEVRPSIGSFGEIEISSTKLPVTAVLGDQQAALFGQRCFEPGMAKNTYGTGCFLVLNVGEIPKISKRGLLTTVAWQIGERVTYALEGSVFVAGAAVQWLRDGLKIIDDSSEVEALASSVSDSDGVLFVPALTGLGAPHWDPNARGAIFGITRKTDVAHIARATLEGIAYQVSDVVEVMQSESPLLELRVDGGAARSDLLLQFQADILGVPLVRPSNLESTAFGIAIASGLGAGVWSRPEEIPRTVGSERRFVPTVSDSHRKELLHRWKRAVSGVVN